MIEKITGLIEKKNKTSLIISVNDISYRIKASLNCITGLPGIGKKTSLLTKNFYGLIFGPDWSATGNLVLILSPFFCIKFIASPL